MPNAFHKMFKLQGYNPECSCLIVDTSFPTAEAVDDGSGDEFNPHHWEKVADGGIETDGTGLKIDGGGKLKWIGSCPQHSRGLQFRINSSVQPGSVGVLFYACDDTLDSATGYAVTWQTVQLPDLSTGCNISVRYQAGDSLINRMLPIGEYGSYLEVIFEHETDADGGGVQITITGPSHGGGSYQTFTHLAGPQISDDQYWGISGGPGVATFRSLTVTHNGHDDETDRRLCRDCDTFSKYTTCDVEAACGGGTLKTQPGATLIDYEWPAEACGTDITPHNSGGWYKECADGGGALNYSWWTFTDLSATLDFTGHGHCGSADEPGSGMGYTAWRYFRVKACSNTVTLTLTMHKSRFIAASATMEIFAACGVASTIFADVTPQGISESWPKATGSITTTGSCGSTSSTYFVTDACVSDESDTVTVDIENMPPGIYRVQVSGTVSEKFTSKASACASSSIDAYPPVKYEFVVEGDALTYDPICR